MPALTITTLLVLLCGGPAAQAVPKQTFELQDALNLHPNPGHGQALFQYCAACHQPDGSGNSEQNIPLIAGQHYSVLLEQLAHFRANERTEPRMGGFASKHYLTGPQDMADVAAYVATLEPRPTTQVGPTAALEAGAAVYARECSRCHGAQAEGRDPLRAPRLAGQHYQYLVLQMQAMKTGERIRRSWDHTRMLGELSAEELGGIAAHLARLPPDRSRPGQ